MTTVKFKQVDVFTAQRYKGNPVAVIMDAQGLSDLQMQQIANWTNLSETTFVLPPTQPSASYRLRIFTPNAELPFAGHPTLGSAHALLESGLVQAHEGELIQECEAGLVRLTVTGTAHQPHIALQLPQPHFTPVTEAQLAALTTALGTPVLPTFQPAVVAVGPRWLVAQMHNAGQVLTNEPDLAAIKALTLEVNATGVLIFGAYPAGSPAAVEVRAYAPACGISEDPVCGSGNGAMAAFIRHTGQTTTFGASLQASQGIRLGRAGQVRLGIEDNVITVGGESITCIEGMIAL